MMDALNGSSYVRFSQYPPHPHRQSAVQAFMTAIADRPSSGTRRTLSTHRARVNGRTTYGSPLFHVKHVLRRQCIIDTDPGQPVNARRCARLVCSISMHSTCFEGNGVKVCLVDPVQQQALHLIEYVIVRSLTLSVRRSTSDPFPFS